MTTISDYRTSVRTMIRDTNSASYAFLDPEIDSFTQSAVLTYSLYRPRKKPYTLTLSQGMGQYTLPTDWVRRDVESFNEAVEPLPDVDINQFASFVLPNLNNSYMLNELVFDWYDSDQYVIVNPTPQATATINFDYYTLHTVNTTTSSVPAQDFDAIVLASSSRALDALAINKGMQMQKYKIGQGLQIDDSQIAKYLQEQARTYEMRFEQLVRFRPFGVSG